MSNCLKLKKSNCKNCYKCIRNCPVKSIRFSAGQAHIIGNDCILCGRCFVVCPQDAKEIVNDTEKDLLVYYESDDGVTGVLPHAAETIYGLAIEDPVAYIDEGDVVRVRVEEVDPRTLDRDTEGVLFVDRTKPGKKLRITGKYMLVNGGDQDVSIAYTTMEGEKTTVVMNPGCVLGFEWLSAEGGMRVV